MSIMLPSDDDIDDDLEPLYEEDHRRHWRWQDPRHKLFIAAAIFGIVSVTALIIVVTVTQLHNIAQGSGSETPAIPTTCGQVIGREEDGISVFRGMRYADSPVGPLRWRPPQKLDEQSLTNCKDTRKAFEFGSQCAQRSKFAKNKIIGSEDCLFINVWTPNIDANANLPVMVYIHGGDLLTGSGNEPDEIPTPELVSSADMVFVTFNYRLGAFGFMALDVLSFRSQEGVSGNYGFLDQIMALIWVRENIRNFGGDPQMVTLFGHGGGGESVWALLMSPQAKGLFNNAWIMSGTPLFNVSREKAESDNLIFLNSSGCVFSTSVDSESCIRSLSSEEVIYAVPWQTFPFWNRSFEYDLPSAKERAGAIGIVDGRFLPRTPKDSLLAGQFNDVPIIIGHTAQDAEEEISLPKTLWNWNDLDNYLRSHLDTLVPNLANLSSEFYPHVVSPEYQFVTMVTDIRVTCPTNLHAALISESFRSPVYHYAVTSVPSAPVRHEGRLKHYAFQSWDLLAFFGTISRYTKIVTSEDLQFSRNLRKMAFEFARTGRLALWKQFPEATTVVSKQIEPILDYKRDVCTFWRKHGIVPKYSKKS